MIDIQVFAVIATCSLINGIAISQSHVSDIDKNRSEMTDKQITDEDGLPWWKTSIIYQIYPRSFMDSNGDGVGDLNGITSKVDYLKDLGVGAVWISPFYVSPMADFGYDISDFVDVDPIFGTLQDFDNLVVEFHKRDMKMIIDFVPNHSSDQHEWFQKSLKRTDPFTDYYVWANSTGVDENGEQIVPNNWLSVIKGSAWTWSDERQQFYFHQYLKEQPDLNVRNPAVLNELKSILRFWLDRGVDGIRTDAIKRLFEVEDLTLDEPVAAVPTVDDPTNYDYLDHPYTINQPETLVATREWKEIMDEYGDRLIMVQMYDDDIQNVMNFYGNDTHPVCDFPFNFYFIDELTHRKNVTGTQIKVIIDTWLESMPVGKWPNWILGSHDGSRIATRVGSDLVDSLNMLVLLLQGTPVTYYGDEIGMQDTFVTFEQATDNAGLRHGPDEYTKYGRDPSRTPMQWDGGINAGFSTTENDTWLPLNENYPEVNVKVQTEAPQSHVKVYQSLATLRKGPTFTKGGMIFPLITDSTFTLLRSLEGHDSYILVINTSQEPETINLNESGNQLPESGIVEIRSVFDTRPETEPGSTVNLAEISLLPSEGIVLKL